jgi:hypothetical protein
MLLTAPPTLYAAFVLLPVGVMALIVTAILWSARQVGLAPGRQRRTTVLALLGAGLWLAGSAWLGLSGQLQDFERATPVFMRVMGFVVGLVVWLAWSPVGTRLVKTLPITALIAFQGFRLPLELAMHKAAEWGVMPVQMSYSGWNFDIVSGATALLLAAWLRKHPSVRLVAVWNGLGSALLLTIMAIAVASTPKFHAFGTRPEQLNTWVAYAPFTWLPFVLVAAALFGHLLVWRWLAAQRRVVI